MTIKTAGKFEGEEDYAPYFYDAMLNGWGKDVEHKGDTLSVFTIDEEDAKRFSQLERRVGELIAFRESDQGFWEEVAAPAGDEPGDEGEPDLEAEAVITDNSRLHRSAFDLSIEGSHKGTYRSQEDAVAAYRAYSKKHRISHNLFFVNERGTVDQLDPETGTFLSGTGGSERDDVESEKPRDWRARPVIRQGHDANLVHDGSSVRVWVSRMTRADGAEEDRQVTVERKVNGRWKTTARSKAGRWVFEDNLAGVGAGGGMRLLFLVPNNAWAFVFGDSLVRLHDEQMFYSDRNDAIAAARRRGLKVARNGAVTTLEGTPPALAGVSNSHAARVALVERANKAGRSSRRSGAPHLTINSSREVLLSWLAWNDPNGVYGDADMRREGYDPMSIDAAWEMLSLVDF